MKTLSVSTIGIKGGAIKNSNTGFIVAYSDNQKLLSIDNYKDSGDDYAQRCEPIICISDGEYCIFKGTHEQLINLIKTTK